MSSEETNNPADTDLTINSLDANLDPVSELVGPPISLSHELLATSDVEALSQLAPLYSLIETGGPVVVILLIMSVVGLAVLLIKLWQFFYLGISRTRFLAGALQAWNNQDVKEMQRILQKSRNPIARVVERAAQVCNDPKMDQNTAREEVLRVASMHLADARSYLRVIEVIAALSPLLGLFGTVLGMIEAFQELEQAGNKVDPAILSGGIWEALLTTAAGLAVAIPAIIALNWLEQKVENFKLAMEDAMTLVFTSKSNLEK
jgi:biopolymer transport protein ExbB